MDGGGATLTRYPPSFLHLGMRNVGLVRALVRLLQRGCQDKRDEAYGLSEPVLSGKPTCIGRDQALKGSLLKHYG